MRLSSNSFGVQWSSSKFWKMRKAKVLDEQEMTWRKYNNTKDKYKRREDDWFENK